MLEKPTPPGMFDKLKDSFGFGNRWEKEYDYVMSLSDEEVKKEADMERLKAGVLPDAPAVSTTEPVTVVPTFGTPTTDATPTSDQRQSATTETQSTTHEQTPAPTTEAPTNETQGVPDNVVPFPQPSPTSERTSTPETAEVNTVSATEVFQTNITYDIATADDQLFGSYEGRDAAPVDSALTTAELLVVGDAHGSALKILETAILSGMIDMPHDKAQLFKRTYSDILALAYDPPIPDQPGEAYPFRSQADKEAFARLQDTLLDCIDTITWIGDDRSLLLIGDVVSDRGLSDIVTMKLLSKMRESGDVTTLAGNHDLDFLMRKAIATHKYTGINHMKLDSQRISELRAVATFTETHRPLIREFFKKMTLFSYSPDTKTFFSHANFRKEFVDSIKARIGFTQDITSQNITSFVERANSWCQGICTRILDDAPIAKEDVQLLSQIVWDRQNYNSSDQIPFSGVIRAFVHGHDTAFSNVYNHRSPAETHAICLDDAYRKGEDDTGTSPIRLYIEGQADTAAVQQAA